MIGSSLQGWNYRKSPTAGLRSNSKLEAGDDQIRLRENPNDVDITSKEQEDEDRILSQNISDVENIPSAEKEGVERVPPQIMVRFGQICQPEKSENILLFKKWNYIYLISVGLTSSKMYFINSFFNT